MSPWGRRVLAGIGMLCLLVLIICADVVLRARDAYLKAEKAPTAQMAYVWYETAATLYTPPESKWSRLARQKMPLAKEKWRAELKERHVPFDEAMLD